MESNKRKISIKTVYAIIIISFVTLGLVGFTLVFLLQSELTRLSDSESNFTLSMEYAEQIRRGSDELTDDIRSFVMTNDEQYFSKYWHDLNVDRMRDGAIDGMKGLGLTDEETEIVSSAVSLSDELITSHESKAMRYILAANGYTDANSVSSFIGDGFTEAARDMIFSHSLSGDAEEYESMAYDLVFGEDYLEAKAKIDEAIDSFNSTVTLRMETAMDDTFHDSLVILGINLGLILLMLIGMAVTLVVLYTMLVGSIIGLKNSLASDSKLNLSGSEELRSLSEHYNRNADDVQAQKRRLEEENEIYRRKSEHDYLTNLVNREVLDEYHRNKFVDPERIPPFVLYMIDVDDFKKFNDTFGHDVGDKVLKAIAAEFKSVALKYSGLAARYGGEEFVITAECIGEEDVNSIADEILNRVRAIRIKNGEEELSVTVSMGSCFSLTGGRDERTILQNADGAMYKSKACGKNCHNRFKYIVG